MGYVAGGTKLGVSVFVWIFLHGLFGNDGCLSGVFVYSLVMLVDFSFSFLCLGIIQRWEMGMYTIR